MTEPGCVNGKPARGEAEELRVRDVMVRRPKSRRPRR
jgi:hypothetical protein